MKRKASTKEGARTILGIHSDRRAEAVDVLMASTSQRERNAPFALSLSKGFDPSTSSGQARLSPNGSYIFEGGFV